MRKLMLLILVQLFVLHDSTARQWIGLINNESSEISPHCGECSVYSTQKYRKTSHICHQVDRAKIIKSTRPGLNPYPHCVPDRYAFEYPIRQYCCFRSPELGCSMLVGQDYYQVFESKCTKCKALCEEKESCGGHRNHANLATILLSLLFLLLALNKILVPT